MLQLRLELRVFLLEARLGCLQLRDARLVVRGRLLVFLSLRVNLAHEARPLLVEVLLHLLLLGHLGGGGVAGGGGSVIIGGVIVDGWWCDGC